MKSGRWFPAHPEVRSSGWSGAEAAIEPLKRCEVCGSTVPCIMCHGSGVYRYTNGVYRCAACWGTGIDHREVAS